MILSLGVLITVVRLASSVCDCGYSLQEFEGGGLVVFMDRLETNFSQLQSIAQSHNWVAQEFTVSAEDGRGNYSKAFEPSNVVIRAAQPRDEPGRDPGVELHVSSVISKNNAIPASEIDTTRLDLHWGSFRAGMKLTDTGGTCAAFFWYFNDTQEIDVEFLSREFDHDGGVYPINLVVQSMASLEAGYDASKTGNFKRVNLEFDPTDTFHEYRFDYIPGHVLFYADGKLLARMEGSDMPSAGGHLILQHWSNGNPLWSGGPPTEEATVTVSYVDAYFNSSDHGRQSYLERQCDRTSMKASVCAIQNIANATSPEGYLGDNDQNDAAGTDASLLRGLGVVFAVLFL